MADKWALRLAEENVRFAIKRAVALRRAAAGKPLSDLLTVLVGFLVAKERTPKYVSETRTQLRRISDECGFRYWSDITAARLMSCLKQLREDGLSFRKSNSYLTVAKQFCNWMVESHYASESPLRHLKPLNTELDRRRERRAAKAFGGC